MLHWYALGRCLVLAAATMTSKEAKKIIALIKKGKRFATRFHEQEWGLAYQPDGRFLEWSFEADLSGQSNGRRSEQLLTESETLELFLRYDYEMTLARLK